MCDLLSTMKILFTSHLLMPKESRKKHFLLRNTCKYLKDFDRYLLNRYLSRKTIPCSLARCEVPRPITNPLGRSHRSNEGFPPCQHALKLCFRIKQTCEVRHKTLRYLQLILFFKPVNSRVGTLYVYTIIVIIT